MPESISYRRFFLSVLSIKIFSINNVSFYGNRLTFLIIIEVSGSFMALIDFKSYF